MKALALISLAFLPATFVAVSPHITHSPRQVLLRANLTRNVLPPQVRLQHAVFRNREEPRRRER